MNVRRVPGVLLCAALGLLAAQVAFSQEKQSGTEPKKPSQAQPGGQEMDEMMAKWMEAATPDENHAKLKPLEGTWVTAVKMRFTPDAPFTENTGTLTRKWIMDGRFLMEEASGDPSPPMNMAFHGMGWVGYDKVIKKYIFAWVDNMGTCIYTGEGTCDGSGKTFNFTGQFNDPMTGQLKKMRTVMTLVSDTKHTYESYDVGPDGKEYCCFQMTCTRK